MKNRTFLLLILVVLGCQDLKKPEKPDQLIEEKIMVQILAEAYMGNAARGVDNKTLRENNFKWDEALYKKYGVDSLLFAQSNAYYTTNLNNYHKLLVQVEQLLEQKKVILDTLVAKEKDSINAQNEARRLQQLQKKRDSTSKSSKK